MNHHPSQQHGDDLALIIGKYALGDLTLGQASEEADMSRWEMADLLQDAGVDLRLGPTDEEEVKREIDVALHAE